MRVTRQWVDRANSLLMAPPKLTPFAIRLVRARKATGLNQDHAAAFVGVSVATYRRWEQAQNEPSASQLVTIAAAFATTTDALLNGTEVAEGPTGLVQRVLLLERTLQKLQESVDALRSDRDGPSGADLNEPSVDDADDLDADGTPATDA